MSDRKRIGIVGWKVGENSIGVTQPYYEFLNLFGDVEILTPNSRLRKLNLLILPGGGDVNPLRYGAIPRLFTSGVNPILEWFDIKMLPEYIKAGVPIFGICRGLQTLNVHFGGNLYQHNMHEYSSESRSDLVHGVNQYYDTEAKVFSANKRVDTFRVNSLHHQCIKDLSGSLNPTLVHSKDGTIEGIMHKTLPIHAVQYHPEEIYDEYSIKIIQQLLEVKKY